MRLFRGAFLLLVTSIVSVSFVLSAEDLPETTYDESESMPFKSSPVVSVGPREETAPIPQLHTLRFCHRHQENMSAHRPERGTAEAHRLFRSIPILDHALRC